MCNFSRYLLNCCPQHHKRVVVRSSKISTGIIFGGIMFFKLFLFVALAATDFNKVTCATQRRTVGIEEIWLGADRLDNVWTASGTNSTGAEIRVAAAVPGGIYSDLEDGGVLDSAIYHEYNDVETRWVGRTNWTFTRNFNVTNALLQKTEVVLVCEGLDTIGDVFINDVLVGKSENMFVRYNFDVKDALREGENTIRVAFTSPVDYTKKKYDEHVQEHGYPIVPEFQLAPEFRGEAKAQMIRKMPSSFSWDWGPSYPNTGIWKHIYIQGYSGAIIRDVMFFTTPSNSFPDETPNTRWNVTARVYYDAAEDVVGTLALNRLDSAGVTNNVNLERGKGNSVDISLIESGADTKLWWPNGYGDQNLYRYEISLETGTDEERDDWVYTIGFRTINLVENFVDSQNRSKGRDFFFTVNGEPMYSKGSNSIPLHVLPERVTEEQTEWLMRSAKLSHQNMIRVWGGGIYESDSYFDYADEYGILIWEDFMFACSMYPATDEFLENVKKEVDTQVKRLQYRPSLAMWAGNNENEAFLRYDLLGTEIRFDTYHADYVKLYADTIKVLTEELDPSRKYIPSSPTNGAKTEEEGWVAEEPMSLNYGDIHFYDYTSDNWDWRMFYRTRYASEYGFQSFPHYETLSGVADNISSWTWDSSQMEHRQRHPRGQAEIREQIRSHLPFPADYNSVEAFPYMVYMSQIVQAMGQKTEAEFYGRLVDKLDVEDGTGRNMGALYWQLNDIWEGCSWASVENNGRWKLQMYYSQKFFSPILASPYRDVNGDLVIQLTSDLPRTIRTAPLDVKIFKLSNSTPIFEYGTHATARFLESPVAYRLWNARLTELGCNEEADSGSADPCVVHVTYSGYPDNFLFLQYPKNKAALKDPQLKVEAVEGSEDGHQISFNLTTQAIAPFVYLTVRGDHHGYFSDNGFLQIEDKELTYYSQNGITPQEFVDRLEVMSLFNVTTIAEDFVPTPLEVVQSNVGSSNSIQHYFRSFPFPLNKN